MPSRLSAAHLGAGFAALSLLLSLGGCSSLSPHIFSEKLLVHRGDDGRFQVPASEPAMTLDLAYADAAFVQRRYLSAVEDQGNATPRLAAGLVALSAVSLYKGITTPDSKELAAAGVLGSGAWAYGNTLISRPRLDVYRAGAEALSCAMAAVDPLRQGQGRQGQPTDAAGSNTLHGKIAQVDERLTALRVRLEQHRPQLRNSTELVGEVAARRTVVMRRPPCEIPPGTSPASRPALRAACDARPAIPVTVDQPKVAGKPQTWLAPASLVAAFRAAEREAALGEAQLKSADAVLAALNEAGPLLWRKSVAIQLAVSEQVDKTVPDLASVLRAAQGMRDTAFTMTGASAFKPTLSGAAQTERRDDSQRRAPSAEDEAAVLAIETATVQLSNARLALDRMARPWSGLGEHNTRRLLNECSVKTTGVQLRVTPSGDEIAVAAGGTAVFFVAGGSGVPNAHVASGPASVVLPVTVEGGQFKFTFTPPASMQPNDTAVLRFTDGAGAASHVVQVRIAAATAPQDTAGAGDSTTSPAGNATATDAIARLATAVRQHLKDNGGIAATLGLAEDAADSQIAATFEACRQREAKDEAAPPVGPRMRQALRDGKCKRSAS